MKKPLTQLIEANDDRPDITPLIDVIFMLLLFFIITTTFAEDTFFPLVLPKAERAITRTLDDTVIVEISINGEYAVDQTFIPGASRLHDTLATIKKKRNIKSVIIKTDQNTPARHLVALLDILSGLDINEFAVTTTPKND